MSRHQHTHTWKSLKENGTLQERHVQMAIDLGLRADTIAVEHAKAHDCGDLILLEWVEDRFFAKHGHYVPTTLATPENQAEHQAENSLLTDYDDALERICAERGIEEDDYDAQAEVLALLEQREQEKPVSYGEIVEDDQRMLLRQKGFRNAARAVSEHLATMAEVQQVRLFGSVALPLWKEVPRHQRLRERKIRIYHECANIDLAVRVNLPVRADKMRKACTLVVNDLTAKDIYLNIAHHTFCIHLIEHQSNRYLGMVCHFNQCPKHKRECQVPGCGAMPFIQVLPWFRLKPERLNEFNSQILFERAE